MQEPFRITPEMEAEISNEIDRLVQDGKESHDPLGTRPRSVSLRRRVVAGADSASPPPRPEDNPPLPAEDAINPSHYRRHPSGIECIEVTRHMNFNVGNAIKYLWRYMDKGDPVENLRKAQWYLDDEIRRLGGK